MPILSMTPARSTLPAVGASTWASGSQVWNGKIGTLIAKASANAAKSQGAAGPSGAGVLPAGARRRTTACPVAACTFQTSTTIATSISSEPAIV